jgi:enoyl-[acyl-carrier-protein] reductase (NADH)
MQSRQGTAEGAVEACAATIPHRRWALPEDIGNAACCVTGKAASYITGQTVFVDGGLSVV